MKYKAIGFDYGGVIAGKTGVSFGQEVSKALGIGFEKYKEVYFKHNKKVNVDGMPWPEFWRIYLDEIGQPEKHAEIMAISAEYQRLLDVINPEMVKLVDGIREAGYKVGLLSNNSQAGGDKMRAEGLDKHFDVFHISEETGFMKPQPEAFNKFAQDLGVAPEELVFIDDSEKSLSTAAVCGFTPVVFESCEKLKKQLKVLNIL
jgi:HAD superfamily hydrolase (TIGR01509 family)